MTACAGVGLTENVIPQRGLAPPTRGYDTDLLGGERGHSHVTGHGFTRREPDALAALQVTDSERMIVLYLALTSDRYRQCNECLHQLSVDFLRPLCLCRAVGVKEQRPVNRALTGYCAESQEIRKERDGIRSQVQLVALANLGMPVPKSGIGELKRYKCAITRADPPRAFTQYLIYKLLSDEPRQKFVKNDPLIVPAQPPASFVEYPVVCYSAVPRFIDEPVMGFKHG